MPIAAALLIALGLIPSVLAAGEGDGWTDVAEFSLVMTGGNSETSTLGFKNTLARAWDKSAFTLRAGGIRSETTAFFREAQGTADDFVISEEETTTTTAENYYLNGRYDRKITDRFFWFAGAGWDKNEFAGIKSRYMAEGGVGNIWFDTDDMKFRTDYGITYTDQEDVVFDPTREDSFLGLRLSWAYFNKLGENAAYENLLVVDENLDETSDWRADMINSLSVAMSERLALKLSLQLLYDNEPSLGTLDLVPVPVEPPLTVDVPLDSLDTVFTASLVVNFL